MENDREHNASADPDRHTKRIMTINYYVFPKIDRDEDGTAWAYDQEDRVICEVFDFSADDTEEELIRKGFAKCDAPGTETFLVEETAWEAYQERMANEV